MMSTTYPMARLGALFAATELTVGGVSQADLSGKLSTLLGLSEADGRIALAFAHEQLRANSSAVLSVPGDLVQALVTRLDHVHANAATEWCASVAARAGACEGTPLGDLLRRLRQCASSPTVTPVTASVAPTQRDQQPSSVDRAVPVAPVSSAPRVLPTAVADEILTSDDESADDLLDELDFDALRTFAPASQSDDLLDGDSADLDGPDDLLDDSEMPG
jgi:hypothetical protein